MGRMAYPAPGVNLLRNRSLLAKALPRAECVALGCARAVLYFEFITLRRSTQSKSMHRLCVRFGAVL